MKLLVTGVTGFIGTHLAKRLIDEGHEVHAVVRPSSKVDSLPVGIKPFVFNGDITTLIDFMAAEKYDGVIHLASLFLAAHKPEDVQELIASNVGFSSQLLEAATKQNIPWFINTGTFWQHYENKEYSPVNLYAATKQAFETVAQYYLETTPINFVTIKLSDTFGPGDTRSKVFNLWMKLAKSGESMDMSPGEQEIDISFISNVVDGYMCMIALLSEEGAAKLRGRSFAIKSGEVAPLKKLAGVFEEATNTTLSINWGGREYRPREVMKTWSEGETIPGWSPKISIREGIRKTFND